jgi:hypothetical protein
MFLALRFNSFNRYISTSLFTLHSPSLHHYSNYFILSFESQDYQPSQSYCIQSNEQGSFQPRSKLHPLWIPTLSSVNMISTTHILLMVCYALSSSRTVVCLDDDMGLRVFNTADGKTLCEVKLKDYVVSGQFACKTRHLQTIHPIDHIWSGVF